MESNKWKLNRIFLTSALICGAISAFGPYWWLIYNFDALIYLILGFALLFAGMTLGGFPVSNKGKYLPHMSYSIGIGTIKFCVLLSIISLFAFAAESINFIRYYGASFSFLGGAFYDYADEGRTMLDQILLSVMQLGTVSYLIVRASDARLSKLSNIVLISGFWGIGLFALMQGSRFPVAVSFILFYVVEKQNKPRGTESRNRVPMRKKLIVIVIFILLLIAFLQLMDTKVVVNTPLTQYEIFPGDQGLKPFWRDLYFATGGSIKPVYNMCDYLGEAPFVFSALWQLFPLHDFYPLSSTLRPLAKFLNAIGICIIADPGTINESANQIARYTSFQWTLLLEYGKIGGLVASFIYGYVMGQVERHRECNFICKVVSPCLIPMAVFAPIYFFNVGRLDWIVIECLFVLALLWLLSQGTFVKGYRCSIDHKEIDNGEH